METRLSLFLMLFCTLLSCDFKKSVSKDLITGLATKGDGLSCDDVYLSDGDKQIKRNTFSYGEKFYLNFGNIEGFNKENERVFPGLQLTVISQAGDTVLKNDDLYAEYAGGIEISPLLLNTHLTVADPMHSGNRYTLCTKIWDKKGKGTFNAKLDFDVVPDKKIEIEKNNVSCHEIYLYSQEREIAVYDSKVKYNENIFMMIEGLNGFEEDSGKVAVGISMKITDSEGNLILNEEDLAGDSAIESSEFKSRIMPNFNFTGSGIKNPVTVEVTVWDKKSTGRLKATSKLTVE